MENKQRKKLVRILTCAVVIVETLIIIGFCVSGMEGSDPIDQPTYAMWVGFNVTGTIEVIVPDTNAGETPDQAWEEAERILSEYTELKDVKLERVFTGTMIYDLVDTEPTNTDANTYMVTVAGKVRGDNVEEAKEHFWEDICSEVAGEMVYFRDRPLRGDRNEKET